MKFNKRVYLTAAVLTMLGANMSFAALEIGDNSIAEGNQAIATGVSSIAVGTNAVATGDNLTGDQIKQKLAENQAKLAEIERLTKLVNDETIDFNQKYAIYNRVKAAQEKIAANNELIKNTLQPNLDSATADYNAFKPEYDETVRQMNERLAYINKLDFSLLATDPNGLDTLATELKQKSEDGFPGVSNDLDFYKTYIQNYIKAKGELDNYKAGLASNTYSGDSIRSGNEAKIDTNGVNLLYLSYLYQNSSGERISTPHKSGLEINLYNSMNGTSIAALDDTRFTSSLNDAISKLNIAKAEVEKLPIAGALTTKVKSNILQYIDLQKDKATAVFNEKHEQYLYDQLKNSNQTEALQHLQNKLKYQEQISTLNTQLTELGNSEYAWPNAYKSWYKANVTDVENSNTLTIKTLSDQYKAAIADKQAKLDDLDKKVKAADAAIKTKERENAQLQPTAQELKDAADAERVKQKLDADKAALDEAKRTLALNDLKNIGTNAISVGNNSLVTGKNAIGIGTDGLITGEDAIGIGRANTVTGTGSAAIGTNNSIRSNNAFVFGNNVNIPTGMDGAIVFGNNSTPKAPTAVDGVTPETTVSFGSKGHERQLVNVAKGEVSELSTDAINGSQLFAVKNSMTTAIDAKANKDASNLDASDVTKWQDKLGNGTATDGNTGLVNGDTVYEAVKDKANTNLDNISKDGQDVIRNLAKGSVKVIDGQNTTVTEGKQGDATTYAVNVSNDAIKGAVQSDLDKKANKDASNLDNTDVSKWQDKLGTGTNTQGSTGLVTGDTLYNAIKDFKPNNLDGEISKDNTDKGVTGDKIAKALEEKANKDASNLDPSDVTKWQDKLGTGSVTDGNTGLVTGDTVYEAVKDKANTNLDNISKDGQDVIRNLAKGSVKVINGQNTTVTEGKQGDATTYAVNVSADAIKGAVQSDLDKKANKDASNLDNADVSKWQDKLGNGTATDGNTGLVNGDTVYEAVKDKANTNLDNISKYGQDVIRNLAKGSIKVINGQNTTVTEGKQGDATTYAVNVSNNAIKDAIQPELNKKANTDASNLSNSDVAKWQNKLGTGSISAGNTGLVTGGTVYEIVKNSAGNPLAVSYDSDKKDVITLQGSNGTKITNLTNGVLTKDSTDAVTGSQLFTTNQQVASNTSAIQSLNGSVKEVGAMAGALAALHPLEYDEDYKLSFAAGYGSYKGSNAGAIGAFYRPNENILFNMGTTLTDNDNIVNAGVSFKFGSSVQKTKPQKDMEELKNRMKMLEDLVNKLVDENNHLKKLSTDRKSFADVPKNHWAAEAVETLHANNVLEGYPDGEFKGDRNMSRYEYAEMLYRAMERGNKVPQSMIDEYKPELDRVKAAQIKVTRESSNATLTPESVGLNAEKLDAMVKSANQNVDKPIVLMSNGNAEMAKKATVIRDYLKSHGVKNTILLDGKVF